MKLTITKYISLSIEVVSVYEGNWLVKTNVLFVNGITKIALISYLSKKSKS